MIQILLPMEALPPLTELMRDFTVKKKARSKMKATKAMAAAIPEKQVEQYAIDISLTCARRPNTAETAAAINAMTCKKRAYVSHLTTTWGIWANLMLFPSKALGSCEKRRRQDKMMVEFGDCAPNS